MKQVLFVFLGGGAGSVLRYMISRSLNSYSSLPWGTFSVNFIGSLLIGILFGLALRQNLLSNNMMLLLVTGFCGGFTTFSAFAYESQTLLRTGDYVNFTLYSFGSLLLGILAIAVGLFLTKLF